MKYPKLPRSALTLSEIGIGCYAVSGVYGKKDPNQFVRLVQRAYELGVTFFDTADLYTGASEVLGRAIKGFRDKVVISTKVGVADGGGRDLSEPHIKRSCEESLRQIGTDYVDLYQVHFDDPNTPISETVAAMEALKRAGKIREYGVGHLPINRVAEYLESSGAVTVMTELSAAARGARQHLLPMCTRHRAGVIGFSVTARGLLTGKIRPGHSFEEGDIRKVDPLFQREALDSSLRVADRLKQIGEAHGRTPAQVAIAWGLVQPSVVAVLTGPSTLEHLEENLGGSGFEVPAEDLAALETFFTEEEAWCSAERWGHLRPIVSVPLNREGDSAYRDLIYAMEAMAELGLVDEARLVGLFKSLVMIARKHGRHYTGSYEDIQKELRQLSP